MSDDICDRLVRFNKHKECVSTDLEVEAADEITRLRDETDEWEKSHNTLVKEIERLREENERLREALKPFSSMAQYCEGMSNSESHCVFVGDLRAAAAAIRDEEE